MSIVGFTVLQLDQLQTQEMFCLHILAKYEKFSTHHRMRLSGFEEWKRQLQWSWWLKDDVYYRIAFSPLLIWFKSLKEKYFFSVWIFPACLCSKFHNVPSFNSTKPWNKVENFSDDRKQTSQISARFDYYFVDFNLTQIPVDSIALPNGEHIRVSRWRLEFIEISHQF